MSGVGDRLEFRGQYFREKHGARYISDAIVGARRISAGFAFMIRQLALIATDERDHRERER